MTIQINNQQIDFPASLADITLGQRIAFHDQYGKALEEKLQKLADEPNELLRDLALQEYHDEMAMSFVSFFSGCTLDAVKGAPAEQVLSLYHTVFFGMLEEEQAMELKSVFEWNREQWHIQSPVLTPEHPMTFGELVDAKQTLKDITEDGGGRWHFLLRACCIFLRKKNEPYTQAMIADDSERMKLFHDLPLDIAVGVGFFLTSSIGLFRNVLASSMPAKAEQVTTSHDTSNSGDGFTSSSQ